MKSHFDNCIILKKGLLISGLVLAIGLVSFKSVSKYTEDNLTFEANENAVATTENTNSNKVYRIQSDTISPDSKIYEKVDIRAEFPGGEKAWQEFIASSLDKYVSAFTKDDYGTLILRMVVDEEGNVSSIEPESMEGTKLAEAVMEVILKGPKWIPGQVDGKMVKSVRFRPVTVVYRDEPDAAKNSLQENDIVDSVDVKAGFPGGGKAFSQMVANTLSKNINQFGSGDFGTCIFTFLVDTTGAISDIQARNMQGSRLAAIGAEMLKNGPRWIPAMKNGQKVKAYHSQPITLKSFRY